MNIHEYQTKELLSQFGVRIPRGAMAYSPEQAAYRAREIGGSSWVVKAQVHTGGRGKAGGIKICVTEQEVYDAADELFGKRLITDQTGRDGKVVYRVYVEGAISIKQELYLGLVLDRKSERIMVVASRFGGQEIEEIASNEAQSIIRSVVEPAVGMQTFQAREIGFALGVAPDLINDVVEVMLGCYQAFEKFDATMVEINPLVVAEDHSVYALDAKMTFDDNALFRHPEISELRDKSQEDAMETRAADRGLGYFGFDGNIACVVNGAGLGMATIEMLRHNGGEAANFIDIGGGATPERVAKAIRLARASPNVTGLLINIFAGINQCDWIVEGIIQALDKDPLDLPLVVRLAGNRVEEGKKLLSKSGLPATRANTLEEAAQRIVQAVKKSSVKSH